MHAQCKGSYEVGTGHGHGMFGSLITLFNSKNPVHAGMWSPQVGKELAQHLSIARGHSNEQRTSMDGSSCFHV